jgi:dTMP kinase
MVRARETSHALFFGTWGFVMLIVIEGIDGTGKETQTKALAEKLRAGGYRVETMSFPRYGQSRGAALVGNYLKGMLGELDPFAAAMLYALDRMEAKTDLNAKIGTSDFVIVDRYVGSNLTHQSARVQGDDEKQRDLKRFIMWLEYECFGLPVPNVEFLLKTSLDVSARNREGRTDSDIHERDQGHLEAAQQQYLQIANERGWFVVDTIAGTYQRAPDDITRELHQSVMRERTYRGGVSSAVTLTGIAKEIFGAEILQDASEDRVKMCVAAVQRGLEYMRKMSK